ncbi:MAG TPA: MMPL family transporter, partial [Acidimicrobiia bacterium]|nr:MMPL family transporter [Acidimicrobiia bacterium]
VSVFASFMLEDIRTVKILGLGLAAAVAIDATVVRMLLVPATMELLGDKNWWIPRWLDRILPKLIVEPQQSTDIQNEPTNTPGSATRAALRTPKERKPTRDARDPEVFA